MDSRLPGTLTACRLVVSLQKTEISKRLKREINARELRCQELGKDSLQVGSAEAAPTARERGACKFTEQAAVRSTSVTGGRSVTRRSVFVRQRTLQRHPEPLLSGVAGPAFALARPDKRKDVVTAGLRDRSRHCLRLGPRSEGASGTCPQCSAASEKATCF